MPVTTAMLTRYATGSLRVPLAAALAAAMWVAVSGSSQTPSPDDERTRQILAEEFVKARPAPRTSRPAGKPSYRRATKSTTPKAANLAEIGVTLWKLGAAAPATSAANAEDARLLVQEKTGTTEAAAERVSLDASLTAGERVRLSIETPRSGHLYVIDRERYSDGSLGEPYLIFPTLRTSGGDNRVTAGRVVEIPAQADRPNHFTLIPSRSGQTGEVLTFVVMSAPVSGLTLGRAPIALERAQAEMWEAGASDAERYDLDGGDGRRWTRIEQAAGADPTRLLTQADPLPQSIYRVPVQPDGRIAVRLTLKYGTSALPPR